MMTPTEFMREYTAVGKNHDLEAILSFIADDAVFLFSNRTSHFGKDAIRRAIERNFDIIKNEEYRIEDMTWLASSDEVAACIYEFHWSGEIDGKPVEGAKVTRKYYSHWYKEHVETVTHTDTNGYFEFGGAWKHAIVGVLHQPVIEEEVVVEYNNTNHTVFEVAKMDYESFGELSAVQNRDREHGKDRLIKKDGKLFLKFDLDSDKVPIGR